MQNYIGNVTLCFTLDNEDISVTLKYCQWNNGNKV